MLGGALVNKKDLSETDICAKYITPAILDAGWDELTQIRREVSFTKGRIIVRGKMVARGKAKRADYILYYKGNHPLAVIEAKDNKHAEGDEIRFQHLVLDDRTQLVAKKVSQFLKESGDRYQKTIIFCIDTEHASRMRQALVNENADLVKENARYVMRITGDDADGCAQLGNFIDPEAKYEDEGVLAIDDPKLLKVAPFNGFGLPLQLIKEFGTRQDFEKAVHDMQAEIYA